jgi:uncharacterized protein YbjT (DUF2867 family)
MSERLACWPYKEPIMFTVVGATGHTGRVVVERLLAAGKQVRVIVRSLDKAPPGTETIVGDVTDRDAVTRALAGAEGAYLMIPPNLGEPDPLAVNRAIVDHYVAALAQANTPHAVFLSSIGSQHAAGTGPIAATHYGEVVLARSATRLTFVRAAGFMENILGSAFTMKSDGVLPVFGGGENAPITMVATRDIGDVAADVLLSSPNATEWIELHGPRAYSYTDAAAIASEVLGRRVTATPVAIEQVEPIMTRIGFSAKGAALYREMIEGRFKWTIEFDGKGRAVKGTTELADVLRRGLA